MILSELLNSLNQNEDVYIGSKSAYIFMDTPETFSNMRIELNDCWRHKFQSAVDKTKMMLDNLKNNPPKENDTSMREVWLAGHRRIKTFTYDELVDEWRLKISKTKESLKVAEQQLSEFIPFEQREVLEHYRNIDNDATIIILDGYESGRFWLKSEWTRYLNGDDVVVIESECEDDENEEATEDEEEFESEESVAVKPKKKISSRTSHKKPKSKLKLTIEEYNANCIWLREHKYDKCQDCIQYGICKDLYKRYLKEN